MPIKKKEMAGDAVMHAGCAVASAGMPVARRWGKDETIAQENSKGDVRKPGKPGTRRSRPDECGDLKRVRWIDPSRGGGVPKSRPIIR
ncbi:hypothetical protein, partial [Desulfoluna sp.]|uniref:hypothetical protein n=1 Tax=Desulfoluna sp. TaxID=2045199 RepID=UPI00262A3876